MYERLIILFAMSLSPSGARYFSLLQGPQTESAAHATSYSIATAGHFPVDEASVT
jgi:hypothetical protein